MSSSQTRGAMIPASAPDPALFGAPIRAGGLVAAPVADATGIDALLALRALAFRGDASADDRDGFDAACLHLRIGRAHGPALATLRLQPQPEGRISGYAASCHDLSALAAAPGPALELGRLCLHPEHAAPAGRAEDGAAGADLMRLVWASVARLTDRCGAARLIGCSSFPGSDPAAHAAALGLLAQRHLGPPALRPARKAPETRPLSDWAAAATPWGAAGMPPLLRAYLALGGWVADHLVIDRDLGTCHIFTCVEIATMPEGRKRLLRAMAGDSAGGNPGT